MSALSKQITLAQPLNRWILEHVVQLVFFRGSVISRIVGANVKDHPNLFQEQVQMFVHEELVEGRKLTDIINSEHENVKYLKGFKLPENVVSVIIELGGLHLQSSSFVEC